MIREDIVKNFVGNIEFERNRLDYTQEEMARALDMSVSAYKKLIAGKVNSISMYTVYLAHRLTGRYGFELCGMPFKGDSSIIRSNLLSDRQRVFIKSMIDFELQFNAAKGEEGEDYITVLVPTGNLEDGMIWDSCSAEKIEASKYIERYGSDLMCGVLITSNHLHPAYNLGDILLIGHSMPRDGDVGIFINNKTGRAYIRKMVQEKKCALVPVNGFGSTFYVDTHNPEEMAQWVKFGHVICKIRD